MSWKEFENENTETLIEYISWRGNPEWAATAQDAFRAFCFRFQKDVAHKCRIICRNNNYDQHIADDLAQRTFDRFWKYPKFDYKKRKTAKDVDTAVKLYLYGIAQTQLYNLKDEEENPSPYTGNEKPTDQLVEIDTRGMSAEQRKVIKEKYELIKKALERLSEKHRVVYCTYAYYQRPGVTLPRHLTKILRDTLGLTQATIQFYKKEATDKITEYLAIYDLKYGN